MEFTILEATDSRKVGIAALATLQVLCLKNNFNFFFFFSLLRAAPAAYGGSQARSRIGAQATGIYHSHGNVGSVPCLRPTPQLMAMSDP